MSSTRCMRSLSDIIQRWQTKSIIQSFCQRPSKSAKNTARTFVGIVVMARNLKLLKWLHCILHLFHCIPDFFFSLCPDSLFSCSISLSLLPITNPHSSPQQKKAPSSFLVFFIYVMISNHPMLTLIIVRYCWIKNLCVCCKVLVVSYQHVKISQKHVLHLCHCCTWFAVRWVYKDGLWVRWHVSLPKPWQGVLPIAYMDFRWRMDSKAMIRFSMPTHSMVFQRA